MFTTCRTLLVVALGAAFLGAPAARADDKKPEKPTKPQPSEPAKPIIIQIDASKLPPDVLKQLLQLSEKKPAQGEPTKPATKPALKPGEKPAVKPGSKVIGLAEAIAIAEKNSQGSAVKAERQSEDGAVRFKVDIQGSKGGRTRVTIDAGGKVTGSEKKEGEGEKDGGKGKKKQDD